MNPGIHVSPYGAVDVTMAGGGRHRLTKHDRSIKLYFKLKGCCRGEQHYKHCTPEALKRESDMWCCFCMYNIGQWKAASKAPISNTELQFMLLLQAQGSSEQWCYQVRHDFWNGCCDFYNWCEDVYVQVDGQCHWRGMHTSSAEKVQDRDLR